MQTKGSNSIYHQNAGRGVMDMDTHNVLVDTIADLTWAKQHGRAVAERIVAGGFPPTAERQRFQK